MKTRVVTIYWNHENGEAKCEWSPDFEGSDWVLKADALVDAIAELKEKYNDLVQR